MTDQAKDKAAMKAHVYFDDNPIVRIFDETEAEESIADLRLDNCTSRAADESLRRLKLYRKSSWVKREWGLEAKLK